MKQETNGRKKNFVLNAYWIIFTQFVITILGLINRKIFMVKMGPELLGINNLFSDVLQLFSFADLGIGSAITFALYRPILDKDNKKIVLLLKFYKRVYKYVILFLVFVSIGFVPYLLYVKTEINLRNLMIYYVLFQANNIIDYFFVYRETYIIACQREREITKISLITNLMKILGQIVIIFIMANFYIYLIFALMCNICRKIWVNCYIARTCPEIRIVGEENLSKKEEKNLFRKALSMLVHRVGNLAINQTDSLIVSYFVSVVQWGFVSNYLVIKNAISTILSKVYSAMLPSMGNLFAEDNNSKQIEIFLIYDFANAWMYMFCYVALVTLSSPFVKLFFGSDAIVADAVISLLFFSFYIDGLRSPISVVREASGAYEKDKWYTILAAVVNLITSIALVKVLGLKGVYIGTICAMVVLIVSRTLVFYKDQFRTSVIPYFINFILHIICSVICLGLTKVTCQWVERKIGANITTFIIMCLIVVIIPNIVWIILHVKSPCQKELFDIIRRKK